MSTTPTATPPSAPAPAAATPAPSAPVAQPSAPVQPSTPAQPPAAAQPSAPAQPVTPAQPSGPQPPAKLNPGDYGSATAAYEAEVGYRQALAEFKEANPDFKLDDESPWPTEAPAAEPAAEAAKPEGEAKPEEAKPEDVPAEDGQKTEEAKPEEEPKYSLDEDPSLTPQALNDLVKGDENLQKALEANPAAKNQLFKMARENAELSQFKGIFPTADSAKFARDTARNAVSIRSMFQQADTPEAMGGAFDRFMQEFAVIDPQTGQQVVDESGAPVYGEDAYLFNEHVVNRYVDSTMEEVESRLAANQYRSDAEREADTDLKLALSIIRGDLNPESVNSDPDLSSLPDDVRSDIEARLNEVKQREEALKQKTQGQTKQQREHARTAANQEFMGEAVKRTYTQVMSTVEALRRGGAVIPEWMLSTTAPGSDRPIFFAEVGKQIDQLIQSDPYTASMFTELEMRPPTPEVLKERVELYDRLLNQQDHEGRSNIRRIVTGIVRAYGKDIQAQQQQGANPPTTAVPEPRSGASPQPKVLTQDDAYRMAEQQLATQHGAQWAMKTPSERLAETMALQRSLLSQSR